MSLAHGRPYLAIPGPSVMPDRVLQAMHRPAPNIYEGELIDLTHSLLPDLKAVARTEGSVAIYIGNGHAAWEAALANVLSRGDRVLALTTGRFGHGWAEMAEEMHIEVDILEFGETGALDYGRIEEALKADASASRPYKAVLSVFVDTSTSVKVDMAAIRAAMDGAGHSALLMADCIASLGCDAFEMDGWGVDVTVTGSQKGLMTPPGVAFVFFSEKADAARESADLATRYWDWRPRANPELYYQFFCGTAPTHHLYGLRAALDILAEEGGVEAAWARHNHLAKAIWAACDAWGAEGPLRMNVAREEERSWAVTSLQLDPGQGEALRKWTASEAGLTLGIGLGRTPADAFFRIGHMGHVNATMVMGALSVIDGGFKALGIPHWAGALEAASRVISGGVG